MIRLSTRLSCCPSTVTPACILGVCTIFFLAQCGRDTTTGEAPERLRNRNGTANTVQPQTEPSTDDIAQQLDHTATSDDPFKNGEWIPKSPRVVDPRLLSDARDRAIGNSCIGATQVYVGDGEVWLFLDVDLATRRSAYAEPPVVYEKRSFHVFILDREGLKGKWRSVNTILTANTNFNTLFKHHGQVHALCHHPYKSDSPTLFRWSQNCFEEVPPEESEKELSVLSVDSSRYADAVLLGLSKANGFPRVLVGAIGFDNYPPYEFLSNDVGVRITLKKSGLEFDRVIAESLTSKPAWKTTLLNLERREQPEE